MHTNRLALIENQVDILNLTRYELMSPRQIRRALTRKSMLETELKVGRLLESSDSVPPDVRRLLVRESYINKHYLMSIYDGSSAADAYVDMLSEQSFMQNVGTAVGKTFSDYANSGAVKAAGRMAGQAADVASRAGSAVATTLAHPIDSVGRAKEELSAEYANWDTALQMFIAAGVMIPVVKTAAGITGVGYYLKKSYDEFNAGETLQAVFSLVLAIMAGAAIEPTPITSEMGPLMKAWATFKNALGAPMRKATELTAQGLAFACSKSPALQALAVWFKQFAGGMLTSLSTNARSICAEFIELATKWGTRLGLSDDVLRVILDFLKTKLGSITQSITQIRAAVMMRPPSVTFARAAVGSAQAVGNVVSGATTAGKGIVSQAAYQGTKSAIAAAKAPATTGYAANTTGTYVPPKKA
jgi:hypothetical protein